MHAATAAGVMAMVTAKTEKNYHIMAFDTSLRDIGISAKDSLSSVDRKLQTCGGGGTDCSVPMTYALKNKIPVDVFVEYTDNETWYGRIHPFQALREYRDTMGRDAKLVVAGMVSTGFSIADPSDAGMLDVVGFDTNAPKVISDFAK
jgi:60 kDa SS-A/Ro ribonucleoprotein